MRGVARKALVPDHVKAAEGERRFDRGGQHDCSGREIAFDDLGRRGQDEPPAPLHLIEVYCRVGLRPESGPPSI